MKQWKNAKKNANSSKNWDEPRIPWKIGTIAQSVHFLSLFCQSLIRGGGAWAHRQEISQKHEGWRESRIWRRSVGTFVYYCRSNATRLMYSSFMFSLPMLSVPCFQVAWFTVLYERVCVCVCVAGHVLVSTSPQSGWSKRVCEKNVKWCVTRSHSHHQCELLCVLACMCVCTFMTMCVCCFACMYVCVRCFFLFISSRLVLSSRSLS